MADGFDMDFRGFDELAADLGQVPYEAGETIHKAVQVTSNNIMKSWRDLAKGDPHAPAYPSSISYDVNMYQGLGGGVIEGEIGPSKSRRQGALGNLKEFGSQNNSGRGFGAKALDENVSDFEAGIAKAIDDANRAADL
jgi:hypothetical protein